MKLRYYLRGLATGILVTALILGRLIRESRPLTDAEIKAKALTLGMVDASSLSLSNVGGSLPPDVTFEPEVSEAPGADPGASVNGGITDSPEPAASSLPSSTAEATQFASSSPEMTTPVPETLESVTIEIFHGDSSHAVSVRLEEAGLVADALEFDDYLVDNGYSKTIRTGTYRIPVGASWEEIVDIIT